MLCRDLFAVLPDDRQVAVRARVAAGVERDQAQCGGEARGQGGLPARPPEGVARCQWGARLLILFLLL